jgi:hypothetical protein
MFRQGPLKVFQYFLSEIGQETNFSLEIPFSVDADHAHHSTMDRVPALLMRVPTLPNMTVDPDNVASNLARSDYIPVQPMPPITSIKAPLPPNPSSLGNAFTSWNHPMSLACL